MLDELREIVKQADLEKLEAWIRRNVHELDVACGMPDTPDTVREAECYTDARLSVLVGDLVRTYAVQDTRSGERNRKRQEVKVIVLGQSNRPHVSRPPTIAPFVPMRRGRMDAF